MPQVPQEEDWLPRPRQEEKGGDAGSPPGHEEEGCGLTTQLLQQLKKNNCFCFRIKIDKYVGRNTQSHGSR